MDTEARNLLWEYLESLTPAEIQFMRARAALKFIIRMRGIKTRSAAIRAAFDIAANLVLDGMFAKSPTCYCGHKKLQHAADGIGCAMPICECMCFYEI